MSKLSFICLFLFTIGVVNNNLSFVEFTRNGSESVEQIVADWYTTKFQYTVFGLEWQSNSITRTFCTGTFIAPNAILTTAHCCILSSKVLIYLRNMPPNLTNEVNILKYHINPAYKFGISKDDIAIVELTENIEWVSPATLDYSGVKCGETVWVYGFGRTEFIQTEGRSLVLKEWSAKVVANCNEKGLIKTYGKNGCIGDSGGPMFNHNGALVGLHSGSGNCSSPNAFNLAVRLASHKHFIQTVLEQKLLIQNSTTYTLYLSVCLAIFLLCISIMCTPLF